MESTFVFTPEQSKTIRDAAAKAKINSDLGGLSAVGAYAPLYAAILEAVRPGITAVLNTLELPPSDDGMGGYYVAYLAGALGKGDETTNDSLTWLVGAYLINSGQGAFSSVIRVQKNGGFAEQLRQCKGFRGGSLA